MHLCFLCKQSTNEGYNIFTSNVFDNTKSFLSLLEEVLNNKLLHQNGSEICCKCCELLNELHLYQKKVKDITEKLHSYLACSSDINVAPVHNIAKANLEQELPICPVLPKSENTITATKTTDLKCHICFKTFGSKSGISRHLKNQHSNTEAAEPPLTAVTVQTEQPNLSEEKIKRNKQNQKPKVYQCSECPKKWKTSGELKSHLTSHSNVKPFICEICGQAYKHKSALDVHVGMHNGICPFTCMYCKKTFTQKGALRRHLPLHTGELIFCLASVTELFVFSGETPYQCDLCGKRFIHHTSFKIHSLSHTGQKSYKCDICSLALLSVSHLKRHMRVHTGEKKYACSTCGKRFAERYNLASHQKLHEAPNGKKVKQT